MKMTERDKMLLILLGVILVIALAAIFPTYGVMDCINNKKANEASIAELDIQLDERLAELRTEFGISDSAVAEDVNRAKKSIEKQIESLTEDAQRLAENTLDLSKNYRINTYWLSGLEYLSGEKSSGEETEDGEINSEKIVNVAYTTGDGGEGSDESSVGKAEFEVGTKKIELSYYDRTLITQVSQDDYCVYFPNEDAEESSVILADYRSSARNFGAFLLYLEHLSAKGAILIDKIEYLEDADAATPSTVQGSGSAEESLEEVVQEGTQEEEVVVVSGYKISIRVLMTSGQNEVQAEAPEEEE